MAFEYIDSPALPDSSEDLAVPEDGMTSRQLALRLGEAAEASSFSVGPIDPNGKVSLRDVQVHITYLTGQLETLRLQLRDHPADRLAHLLREMIEEREHELERWLAQEQRWDERIAVIENAIIEREVYRAREGELLRERDEARRTAAIAEARLETARRAAEEAARKAAAMERAAEKAQAEQLRLRQERELDAGQWQKERQRLAAQNETRVGWLARFMRG